MEIQHDKTNHKFYNITDGKESVMEYKELPNSTLEYYSTFVPPELRGKQIGEKIVLFALDYARENNKKVVPTCPFVKRIVDRHSEYNDLIQ